MVLVIALFGGSATAFGQFNDKSADLAALPKAPDGFTVTFFASEPLVRQPCSMAFDERGRLFVGMGPQCRNPTPETPGDSVVIVQDMNGDGQADRITEFATGFNAIQALAWHGRDLWIANAPDLTMVRDRDGDDAADEYVRFYTDLGNLEHGLHGLNWAPDGKLYMSDLATFLLSMRAPVVATPTGAPTTASHQVSIETGFSVEEKTDRLCISLMARPIADFVFRNDKILRPYFANARLPNGLQVTRNHPPVHGIDALDHDTMHPGIWLGFGDLSGQDFWRNKAAIEHVRFVSPPTTTDDGSPRNFRESWWHNRDYGVFVANPFGREAMQQGARSTVTVAKGETLDIAFGALVHDQRDVNTAAEFEAFTQILMVGASSTADR